MLALKRDAAWAIAIYIAWVSLGHEWLDYSVSALKMLLLGAAILGWLSGFLPDDEEIGRRVGWAERWRYWWQNPQALSSPTRGLWLLLGIAVLWWGGALIGPSLRLKARGKTIDATVEQEWACDSSAPIHSRWAKEKCLRYGWAAPAGHVSVEGQLGASFMNRPMKGNLLAVRYLPGEPSVNEILENSTGSWFWIASGLFLMALYLLFWAAAETAHWRAISFDRNRARKWTLGSKEAR